MNKPLSITDMVEKKNIQRFVHQMEKKDFLKYFLPYFLEKNDFFKTSTTEIASMKYIVKKANIHFELKKLKLPSYSFYHFKIYNSKTFELNKILYMNALFSEFVSSNLHISKSINNEVSYYSDEYSIIIDPLLSFKLGFHLDHDTGHSFLLKDIFTKQVANEIKLKAIKYYVPTYVKIKSNIIYPVIWSSYKDKCMDYIVFKENEKYLEYEYETPAYHKVNLEALEELHIDMLDANNKKLEALFGSPTCILFFIRERIMKNYFNLFLSSKDSFSKTINKKNTFYDFKIQLPHRISFNSEWNVMLRSITVPNFICNICEEYCNFTINVHSSEVVHVIKLSDAYVSSNEEFIDKLNERCRLLSLEFKLENKKVIIKNKTPIALTLKCHYLFAKMLGFDVDEDNGTFDLILTGNSTIKSSSDLDIFFVKQKMIIVCCDIVSPTYFGSIKAQILKLVHIDELHDSNIHINFKDNDYHSLLHRSFSSISVKLYDMSFKQLRFDQSKILSTQDTVLSLQFFK